MTNSWQLADPTVRPLEWHHVEMVIGKRGRVTFYEDGKRLPKTHPRVAWYRKLWQIT